MPPKKKLDSGAAATNGAGKISVGSSSPAESDEIAATVHHWIRHGSPPPKAPPRVLMDLLYVLAGYFSCVVQAGDWRNTSAAVNDEKSPCTGADGLDQFERDEGKSRTHHGSSTTTPSGRKGCDFASQLEVVLSVAIPHRARHFFSNSSLAGAAKTHKRRRSESPGNGKSSLVEDLRSGAAVLDAQAQQLTDALVAYATQHLPPFVSDADYLTSRDAFFVLRNNATVVTGFGLGSNYMTTVRAFNVDYVRQCIPCTQAIIHLVSSCIEAQLAGMVRPPRLIRLARLLHLTPKEEQAFEYILLCHCGSMVPTMGSAMLVPASITAHNNLTPQETLSILSDSSTLWRQGLLFSDIKHRLSFMDSRYAIPVEAVAALTGSALSQEQLIKLERTTLADVLAAEGITGETLGEKKPEPAVSSSAPASEEKGKANSLSEKEEGKGEGATRKDRSVDVTDELLDEAAAHIDPKIMRSGDAAAIQKAIEDYIVATYGGTAEEGESVLSDATAPPSGTASRGPSPPLPCLTDPAEGKMEEAEKKEHPTSAAGESAGGLRWGDLLSPSETAAPPERLLLASIDPFAQHPRKGRAASLKRDHDSATTLHDTPFTTDIDYMDDAFGILANIIRVRHAEGDMKDEEDQNLMKSKVEASIRELRGKVRVAAVAHKARLKRTLEQRHATGFEPRIEALARKLQLTEMEKQIMLFLVANATSDDVLVAINGRYVMRDGARFITVGYLLFILCQGLEERMVARRAFYQSAPLVKNGIISLSPQLSGRSVFNTDLTDYVIDIDRKIVDYVMGTEAETSEMVPGSRLYYPNVELDHVVLPVETMQRVLSTIEHYDLFERCKKKSGFGAGLGSCQSGLVMLFYGPSGTGKTMLANAVGRKLGKQILLVNASQMKTRNQQDEALRFIFREARLSDAIVFFDECETLFENRDTNSTVTTLLAEFERYDGMIILATNKAQHLDEAMNRRISLMMEFKPPDHQLRLRIWKSHIPQSLSLAEDVSVDRLALNYELSGGLIRNAVLAALSNAVSRELTDTPTLRMSDFEDGARLQLRGFFMAAERPKGLSESYLIPKRSLSELVLESAMQKKLEGIASAAKSRSTLFTQWGFSEERLQDGGALYLFQGPSGTGKSLAAEGIAYECGASIRLCNVAELLLTADMKVNEIFEEGRRLGAVIVFDEAQILFNQSERSMQLTQLIQYHAATYAKPIIVVATTVGHDGAGGRSLFAVSSINTQSTCMIFKEVVSFAMPSRSLRKTLWKQAFPSQVPLAPNVDFEVLCGSAISPKLIQAVAFGACSAATLLPVGKREVTMEMIRSELEATAIRQRSSLTSGAMFA